MNIESSRGACGQGGVAARPAACAESRMCCLSAGHRSSRSGSSRRPRSSAARSRCPPRRSPWAGPHPTTRTARRGAGTGSPRQASESRTGRPTHAEPDAGLTRFVPSARTMLPGPPHMQCRVRVLERDRLISVRSPSPSRRDLDAQSMPGLAAPVGGQRSLLGPASTACVPVCVVGPSRFRRARRSGRRPRRPGQPRPARPRTAAGAGAVGAAVAVRARATTGRRCRRSPPVLCNPARKTSDSSSSVGPMCSLMSRPPCGVAPPSALRGPGGRASARSARRHRGSPRSRRTRGPRRSGAPPRPAAGAAGPGRPATRHPRSRPGPRSTRSACPGRPRDGDSRRVRRQADTCALTIIRRT